MGNEKANILVVDDDITTLELLEAELDEQGYRVFTATNLEELKARVRERSFDAVLLDLFLGEDNALQAIPEILRALPYAKVIVMSAQGTIELAVDALEKGATTFLSKSKDPKELIPALNQKLAQAKGSEKIGTPLRDTGIIGQTEAIAQVTLKIEQFKDVDSTVIVTGESGTGKELVARAIHNLSKRATARFEAVNCGAIPENLLESELFGHKRGAFTDAKNDRKGLFEVCSGGTLFLDEIGEMPLSLQVKLLRVLQEREVTPVGASQSVKVDTRVVAATNRDLAEEVKAGRFRSDLYYRLNVLRIPLPSLRERKEDIPLLVSFFLERFNHRFSKSIARPTKELEVRLISYGWPGNIRELQNAVERGVVLSTDGLLHFEHMLEPTNQLPEGASSSPPDADPMMWSGPLSEAKKQFEKAYLQQLLTATGGNVSEVARISGRYRTDIYRLLTKYGMESEAFR